MNEMLTLSETSGYLHSLNAPNVVAAIAVKRQRHIETHGNDPITIQMLHLKTFDFARLAIENYDPTFKFIGTDLPYRNELTLEQVKERTKKKGNQETKQRQNGENGSLQETETNTLLVDKAECYMVNNYAGIMLEMQQFEATDSFPKEQTPLLAQAYVRHTLTRLEASEIAEKLIRRLFNEEPTEELYSEVENALNQHVISVLPVLQKELLQMWSSMGKQTAVRKWLRNAKKDSEVTSWIEVSTKEGPAICSQNPSDTLLDELVLMADKKELPPGVQMKIEQTVQALRHYFQTIETRHEQLVLVEGKRQLEKEMEKMKLEIRDLLQTSRVLKKEIEQGLKRTYSQVFLDK